MLIDGASAACTPGNCQNVNPKICGALFSAISGAKATAYVCGKKTSNIWLKWIKCPKKIFLKNQIQNVFSSLAVENILHEWLLCLCYEFSCASAEKFAVLVVKIQLNM